MREFRRVCVYCGSRDQIGDVYRQAARDMGQLLAERGIGLVFGGGNVGLMGEVADAALAAGGEVFGVIPEKLQQREVGHTGCTELFVVDSMHARKMLMAQLSDAFIGLPGGFGTMEEIFEVTTWTQLRFHRKPVGLLNVEGYYDLLLAWLTQATQQGFVGEQDASLLASETDAGKLLETLQGMDISEQPRWMERP